MIINSENARRGVSRERKNERERERERKTKKEREKKKKKKKKNKKTIMRVCSLTWQRDRLGSLPAQGAWPIANGLGETARRSLRSQSWRDPHL